MINQQVIFSQPQGLRQQMRPTRWIRRLFGMSRLVGRFPRVSPAWEGTMETGASRLTACSSSRRVVKLQMLLVNWQAGTVWQARRAPGG